MKEFFKNEFEKDKVYGVYLSKRRKYYCIPVNLEFDQDIFQHLEKIKNKNNKDKGSGVSEYLRKLIRDDIKRVGK